MRINALTMEDLNRSRGTEQGRETIGDVRREERPRERRRTEEEERVRERRN